jgi:hypothetical protein
MSKQADTFAQRAAEIEMGKEEWGAMARAMVQATLPHREVDGAVYIRRNGNLTLKIVSDPEIGVPWGSIPRLLLAWIATEAKAQGRVIVAGGSMAAFMRRLGYEARGGVRGDIGRFKEQAQRLFEASVSMIYEDEGRRAVQPLPVIDGYELWKREDDNRQLVVTLSERFYEEVTQHRVPVNMECLRALKQSPLALDIYCWLTYRCHTATAPLTLPWALLAEQFGADYGRVTDFRVKFVRVLQKVRGLIPDAQVDADFYALHIHPRLTLSSPSVQSTPDTCG